jgi:hypothetical protein
LIFVAAAYYNFLMRISLPGLLLIASCVSSAFAQKADLGFLNHNRPILDAHNCYPGDHVRRALNSGFPVSIEQDLAWYVDPATHKGRAVVGHSSNPTADEPELRQYFFEQVRPIVEKALTQHKTDQWPLIILHFDFKTNQPELLKAVWKLLGEYEPWLSTAKKTSNPNTLSPVERRPIMAITEDSDAQEKVFFDNVPVGSNLRIFGSAHTAAITASTASERHHIEATIAPEELIQGHPTNYRRWWNSSWYSVEEGGQTHAGEWTDADDKRLRSIVDYGHSRGFWVRFYTLDGFDPQHNQGWGTDYNFGSPQAVIPRWKAAIAAGVNFIAVDQYEEFADYLPQYAKDLRPSASQQK